MDTATFTRSLRSSATPLFTALRKLADAPLRAVAAVDGLGWPAWDRSRDGATSIDPDGSPVRHVVIATVLLLALFALPSYAQVCAGVGYHPAQFAGKPDPWPKNHPLPNDQLAAAYFARYGQHPGNPSVPEGLKVPGYFDELDFVSYGSLENAGNASATGPGGEALHPGCPTTTEETDFAFTVPKGSPYIFTWFVSRLDGATPTSAINQHDPLKPCGLSSVPKSIFGFWPIYYTNPAPCGGTPPPVCGDGKVDPGETCLTCPADAGACPPPPPPVCPQLVPVPVATLTNCANLAQALRLTAPGIRAALRNVCGTLTSIQAYQPKP